MGVFREMEKRNMKKLIGCMLAAILILSLARPVYATQPGSEDAGALPTECAHSFGAWSDTGDSHCQICSLCGAARSGSHSWDAGTVTKAPTCVEAGTKTFSCGVCGASKTESVPPAGHTYGSWQRRDDSSHSRSCTVCGGEETGTHRWDDGQVTTPATCLAQGEKTYLCADCGDAKKETLPVSDHAYAQWYVDEKNHSRTCGVCGKAESGPHNWSAGMVEIPATCAEEGALVYVCSECGGALIELIPKLTTHTYDNACDSDCNVCGETRDAKHKFSAAWSKNSMEHWHVCTLCGERAEVGSHYPGPAATEEKAQLCLTCGYTMTPRLNHTHHFSDRLSRDETGHWYACDGCEEQKDFEEHLFDSPCDPDCRLCGYERAVVHDYGENWSFDETGHWTVCGLCGRESVRESHVPGQEETAEKPRLCTVCGYELAPAGEHAHAFDQRWQTDDTSHWKLCACGEKSEEGPHLWDNGAENPDGSVIYTCVVCGAARTEQPEPPFPWWAVCLAAVLLCAACAAAVVLYRKSSQPSGKYMRR